MISLIIHILFKLDRGSTTEDTTLYMMKFLHILSHLTLREYTFSIRMFNVNNRLPPDALTTMNPLQAEKSSFEMLILLIKGYMRT